jgi:hypothetical protein
MSGTILDVLNDAMDTAEQDFNDAAKEVTDIAGNDADGRSVTSSSSSSSTTSSTLTASNVGTSSISTTGTTSADSRDAQVTRLYDTVFDRAPDSEGQAFWTDALNRGTSLDTLADLFTVSPEFQSRYGAVNNREFVDLLYRNTLNREADDAGREFWTSGLQWGVVDRNDVVLAFSESPEHVAKLTLGSDDPLV